MVIHGPNGTAVVVNTAGKMEVCSITKVHSLHTNVDHGEMYSVLVDVTTASTDDDFFYLKNIFGERPFKQQEVEVIVKKSEKVKKSSKKEDEISKDSSK